MTIRSTDVILEQGASHVPATFTIPDEPALTVPAVLLLHGTASSRDEVGDMFRRAADALAAAGVASLRIDFPGCGDSDRPQTAFTVTNELADAQTAFDWLCAHEGIDAGRVSVVGFSQGGMIATLLAARDPRVAGLVTWSSGLIPTDDRNRSFAHLFENEDDAVAADLGFMVFTFSREWWDEFRTVDLETAIRQFDGPVLAISGSADDVVSPSSSIALVTQAPGADRTLVQIPGGDHLFNVLTDDGSDVSQIVIDTTLDWITAHATRALTAGAVSAR
ncbi:alpha/beta hydrolase family protein [Microbacterium mangrovi]|uniref:alpha/beta hydrolase family protein n=1 Tax=Microbacterium mangrovi TaxID=1348253 RepID=UPI00068AF4E2|nr:alpha/beta fold hydrolase [Microbacterium mangrovi]